MKKINILIFSCFLGALALPSCSSDFLEVSPTDKLQTASFYKTPLQVEQAITGIYADLRYLSCDEYLYMSECRSDNTWVNPQTDGLREYSEIGTFRAGNDITTFNGVWTYWYKVILDANTVIEKIPDVTFTDETIKNQFLGEALFMRGWAYFELTRLFGNIPVVDKASSAEEVASIAQSPAVDVYNNRIVPDMVEAISLLPEPSKMKTATGGSAVSYGRADKIAAEAMLGRIYMTMAGFPVKDATAQDKAETLLKAVIDYSAANNNKYWAADSTEWKKQWISENNNRYSIFAIQYRAGGTGNTAVFNFAPSFPTSYTSIRIYGNQIYIEKTLMYEFDKVYSNGNTDARGYNTTICTGYAAETNYPTYSNIKEPCSVPNGTDSIVYANTMFYKYMNSKVKRAALGYTADIEGTMKDYNDWPVNYPVIRLEDIQLMYAEILLNKYNDVSGSIAIVNKIRKRAGCDLYSTALSADEAMKALKKERRIELAGEGVRWFDLVRWNEWQGAIKSKFTRYNSQYTDISNVKEGRYLYPIPLNQLNVVPGLYNQNSDYD